MYPLLAMNVCLFIFHDRVFLFGHDCVCLMVMNVCLSTGYDCVSLLVMTVCLSSSRDCVSLLSMIMFLLLICI